MRRLDEIDNHGSRIDPGGSRTAAVSRRLIDKPPPLQQVLPGMDLHLNYAAPFTRWAVERGLMHQPFVVVDVGVQGGENPRWHVLGDHLVVYGFDAIEEVINDLQRQNPA